MSVCLVGNGPLSQEDREFIGSSKCDQVWRFNDMKNMQEGERCDGHFVRSNGKSYWGIENPPKFVTDVPLIVIGDAEKLPPKDRVIETLSTDTVYTDCTDCVNDCRTDAEWQFTSGAIGISYFEGQEHIKVIHLIGMNFKQPANSKHDIHEKSMLDSCCTKCILHPTYKDTYLP